MGKAFLSLSGLLAAATVFLVTGASATSGESVLLAEVDGPITPVVADYLEDAVSRAEAADSVLVVTLDTPGGLDVSMRDIVQAFLNSRIPVVAFVYPQGARAASAGTFITMSAHVAAMAPATSIGAATPVDLQGGEITDKVINDAVAFAVSVAERRGRDAAFAEDAVRDGVSITAREAEERGVIDLQASDLDDLLDRIDGLAVDVGADQVTLSTGGAAIERHDLSTFRRVIGTLADPNLAFIFISFGTLAIVYEAANPGLGFAGIAGVISLVLGFFALSVLPVTTAGVALLILAAALFIGEVFVPGVGVMAAGGTIALVLAGLFLFEGTLSINPPVLWPTAVVLGAATTQAGRLAIRSRRARPTTGASTLVGRAVTVSPRDERSGDAFVDGAWWTVRALEGPLRPGPASVVGIDGLTLIVRPIGEVNEH